MLRSDPGEFRRPAPKQRENSRTVFSRSMHTWCERNKSRQRDFRSSWWSPGGGAGLLQGLASTPARRGKVCSRLTAKASLVQREVANEMSRRDCRHKLWHNFISPSAGRSHPPVTPPRRRRLPTRSPRRVVLTMPLQKAFAARRPQTIPHIRKVFCKIPPRTGPGFLAHL